MSDVIWYVQNCSTIINCHFQSMFDAVWYSLIWLISHKLWLYKWIVRIYCKSNFHATSWQNALICKELLFKIKTYFKLLFAYSHIRKDALTKWRLGSIINDLTCTFVTQYRLYFVTWYTLWSWASLCLSYSYITTFQKDVFFQFHNSVFFWWKNLHFK